MASVPNQKTITVKKDICDKEHLYAKINLEALQYAMLTLKNETLKLWLYMSKNQKGYTFALSKVDAIKWGVGSKSSYDRAVAELIANGHLVQTGGNTYDFYEMPPKAKQEMLITKKD